MGEKRNFGSTHGGTPIETEAFGDGDLPVLLIGGVHGDEPEGFLLVERLLAELRSGLALPAGVRLYVCARLNADGCAVNRRTNGRNVDLNRNLPTADWDAAFTNVRYYPGQAAGSEPESVATLEMIEKLQPAAIFSMHSYEHAMVNFNGDCEDLAKAMGELNGLPPKGDIGYPTPGSLGTYAGWERNIPTITLEILRDQPAEPVYKQHRDPLLAAIAYYTEHPLPARKEPVLQ